MKKIFFVLAMAVACIMGKPASAQVHVNINIGSQPVWGPVGYDYVEYYYLPDIEAYYYVPRHQYVYLSNGRWIFSASLPFRYRSYDLYSGYKVVINEPRPYMHFQTHRVEYARYRGNREQVIIRNSDDPKYYVVKGHPKYNGHDNGRWNGGFNNGRGNGRGNDDFGNGRGNGKGNGHGNGERGGKGKGRGNH